MKADSNESIFIMATAVGIIVMAAMFAYFQEYSECSSVGGVLVKTAFGYDCVMPR